MEEADNFVSPSNISPHGAQRDLISVGWGTDGGCGAGRIHLAENNRIRNGSAAGGGHCAVALFFIYFFFFWSGFPQRRLSKR